MSKSRDRHRPTVSVGLVSTALALGLGALGCADDTRLHPAPVPIDWSVGEVVATADQGLLAELETPYGPLLIARLRGTHYEMGVQYGALLSDRILHLWHDVFVPYVAKEAEIGETGVDIVFGGQLDAVWKLMEPNTPEEFLDEIRGIRDGAARAGAEQPDDVARMALRILLLVEVSQSSATGEGIGALDDFVADGYSQGFADYFGLGPAASWNAAERTCRASESRARMACDSASVSVAPKVMRTCSFFAVWGDRTDGRQLASRLLDWDRDIGLQHYRLVTVFQPEGGAAHATVGYVGFLGALAGMSERGLAIGQVGATSLHERLASEPGTLKSREILEKATGLSDGLTYLANTVGDGILRPGTIGANAMLVFGDPAGAGAAAEGAAAETTGIFSSAFRRGPYPSCTEQAHLYEMGADGTLARQWTHEAHPDVVNLEGEAVELDALGQPRRFQVDAQGAFVRNTDGSLVDDASGKPYPVGLPLPCALFRGDEAMAHGVRRYQVAANGPQGDSQHKLMHLSGTYRERYVPQHDMIRAYYEGASYSWDGKPVIAGTGGQRVRIGPEEAKRIAQVAAMDGNIFSVIYDTTNLVMHVAYESGTGESWKRAADNDYVELRLGDLLK